MSEEVPYHHSGQPWREMLVEYSLDAVVGINTQSLIVDWNPQAEKTFGWTRVEVMGKNVADLIIPPEFREAHHRGIKHFLQTGNGPILNKRIELEAMHSSGKKFSIELTVSPIQTNDELLFYSFVRDITERKKAESTLKDSLREKDEFISVCSHELKTPITSMKLQFQMAKKRLEENAPNSLERAAVLRRINMTLGQIEKMSKLIEDMLDVSKVPLGKFEQEKKPVEFKKIVKNLFSEFQEQFDSLGIKATMVLPVEKVFILGDAYRLEQVLSNLISNAIKYGEGSPIHVELTCDEGKVTLGVSDKGKGISPENQEKIFLRYTRLETRYKASGLGLGLYITKTIVESHNGTIKVRSELGKGTTFMVEFPELKNH